MSDETADQPPEEYLTRDDEALRQHVVTQYAEADRIRELLDQREPHVWVETGNLANFITEDQLSELDGTKSVILYFSIEMTPEVREAIPIIIEELVGRLWENEKMLHLIVPGPTFFFDQD
jgi:hypothetical protein